MAARGRARCGLDDHFYTRLFAANPELLELFNRGHQRTGLQQQALTLAAAACAERLANGAGHPLGGPADFMAAQIRALRDLGIEAPRIHAERFSTGVPTHLGA